MWGQKIVVTFAAQIVKERFIPMFCPECGTKVDDDALFCPECGTKLDPVLDAPDRPTPVVEEVEEEDNTPTLPPVQVRGYILTNIASLARRLGVEGSEIRRLISAYIVALRQGGIDYQLIDASDYTYKKRGLFGTKHVSLTQDDAWYDYADLLKDMHDEELRQKQKESEFVFIIGGDEDVPMPCLPNFMSGGHDKDMDTDLLYAYPYGKDMAEKLMTQDLFRYDALFYIGRLPIASDGSIQDLAGYLRRALENEMSVAVDEAYTQCDPHWRGVTAAITSPLYKADLYPRYRNDIPTEILYEGYIFQTPYVMVNPNTGQQQPEVFNVDANYFFFNMHGASERRSSGFYGVSLREGEGGCEGISPSVLATMKNPNILFTQACYGGRFIDYPTKASMMLTAITHQSLIYVGSSRVAYGAVDHPQGICLSTSDVLAKTFNERILTGMPAGRAFFEARVATYKNRPGDPCHALTIAEFNLYGDPLISIRRADKAYSGSKAAMLGANDKVGVVQEQVLMNKSVGGQQSLLDQVRQAVDRNIMEISKTMAKNLYEQYNLPAREPSVITKRVFADGHTDMCFTYPLGDDKDGTINEALVTTDSQGEMQQVLITK